jgi:hypothetical protein
VVLTLATASFLSRISASLAWLALLMNGSLAFEKKNNKNEILSVKSPAKDKITL